MNEHEPSMVIHLLSGEFEATRDNTSLFTFLGRAAFNHVFLHTGEEVDGVMSGTYVFSCNPTYTDMETFMINNEYPLHMNLPYVAECDINAFNNMVASQCTDLDQIPEEWA